jgi:hypothetical protein
MVLKEMTMASRLAHRTAWPLTLVVATGAAAAFAAGPTAAAQPSATHGWRIVKTINVTSLQLIDVAAVSGGKAWVSGGAGTSLISPLFYHWTGSKWLKSVPPAVSGSSVWAQDISASSDSNVWSGLANSAVFDHWNGHKWTQVSFGTTDAARASGVVAIGRHQARAFTTDFTISPFQDTAHFFNGSAWTSAMAPAQVDADGTFISISASSAANIWAWAFDPVLHRWEALRFNGKAWNVVTVPAAFIPHHGTITGGGSEMLAESASNVWATVNSENLAGPIALLHWNGKSWQKAGGHPPAGDLLGPIASDGRGGLWLYAAKPASKFPFIRPFFVHYHRGVWTTVAAPTSRLGFLQISAIAHIPGTRSLWGVGTIVKGENSVGGAIIKFGR